MQKNNKIFQFFLITTNEGRIFFAAYFFLTCIFIKWWMLWKQIDNYLIKNAHTLKLWWLQCKTLDFFHLECLKIIFDCAFNLNFCEINNGFASQSRKDRWCLCLISNMIMRFLAKWSALKLIKLWIMSNFFMFSCNQK